jgi:hypothetical protein
MLKRLFFGNLKSSYSLFKPVQKYAFNGLGGFGRATGDPFENARAI